MESQLKRLTMYNEVKNLFKKGLRINQISRSTGLDRKTVRKYLQMNSQGFQDHLSSMTCRHRKLEDYEEFFRGRIRQCPDCSAAQVEDWLKEQYPDLDDISIILKKTTRLSRVILWADGFSFSPCCQRVSAVLTSFRNLSPAT
ncbi:MAG: hypothetical protein RI826_10220 [Chlorobium phaeovibrioides]|nr:hypothetical protein [Chlorobium phaeovibrioides]